MGSDFSNALGRVLSDQGAGMLALDKLAGERSLLEFITHGWHVLEPAAKFVKGWALGAICEHLEAVSRGEIKRLLINVPPGCTKSMTVNVFWPAWEWGPQGRPEIRFISASYNRELAVRDNVKCRDLINSDWFQDCWGDRFSWKGDQREKILYMNDHTGTRFATSVGGGVTGHRADRIIVDDPHNVQDAESDVVREEALRWFSEVLSSRVNDPDTAAFVVIMQRVHERDVSGHVLAKELGYEHLMLPMEYDLDHPYPTSTSLGFKDPRTTDGELLWPERFSAEAVELMKKDLMSWGGSYAVSGQFQQRPAPRGGGMFQRDDFTIIDEAPTNVRVRCRGWDLAATKDGGAYTAGVKMSLTREGRVCIEDVRLGQLAPMGVEHLLLSCAQQDGIRTVQDIPQDPGQAGKSQKSAYIRLLQGYDVRFSPESGSKPDRAKPLAAQAEGGNVDIVRGPWNDAFLAEACVFPASTFKDQIDAASRAYARLIMKKNRLAPSAPQIIGGDY